MQTAEWRSESLVVRGIPEWAVKIELTHKLWLLTHYYQTRGTYATMDYDEVDSTIAQLGFTIEYH